VAFLFEYADLIVVLAGRWGEPRPKRVKLSIFGNCSS